MTARKMTAKERATSAPADPIARENGIKAAQDATRKAERLHLDPTTGATVLTPKATPVKYSALRDDKLSMRVVVVTKASRVRDAFAAGMSLTEASKATGADPAYTWDLAKIWEEKTGTRVPRSGHAKKVVVAVEKVAKAPAVKKTPAKKAAAKTGAVKAPQGLRQKDVDEILDDAQDDDLLPA